MTTNLKYESIISKNADELFAEYTVEELGQIIDKVNKDVTSKRQRLKMLVGNKYRDLLNVADDIIKMDTITIKQNDEIMNLTYKKSNYNSKRLANLSKFNTDIQNLKLQKHQIENKHKMFNNVVHDLSYLILTLKNNLNFEAHEDELFEIHPYDHQDLLMNFEESSDNYKPISTHLINDFVIISKQIYLIDYFFQQTLESQSSQLSVLQFHQLRNEFHSIIEFYIAQLKHESDSDFSLNLSLSYLISTKKTVDIVEWMTDKRLKYFANLVKSKLRFHDLLNYIFTTIEFTHTIKSRLSLLINRAKSNTISSNWIQQTPFKKWEQWLDLKNCEFNIQSPGFDKSKSDQIVSAWKKEISELLLLKFEEEFEKSSGSLTSMVLLLKTVLISFKNFTSLTSLPVEDDQIVHYIIEKWKKLFSTQLKSQINEFSDISDVVIDVYNNEEEILRSQSEFNDVLLLDYNKEFSIDLFFESLQKTKKANKVFNLLDNFTTDIKSIVKSIDSLRFLTTLVIKPVISIDDAEDDEFWNEIATTLKSLLQTSAEESIFHLSDSINEFFRKLSVEISKDSVSNIRYFYIIRILIELGDKIQLEEFYETFNKYASTPKSPVEFNKSVESLLQRCFEYICNSVFDSCQPQFEEIFKNRPQKEYYESALWETVDGKQVPTMCSIEVTSFLLTYVSNLVNVENNTYANLFTLRAFEKARVNIIEKFLDRIKEFIQTTEITDSVILLITYADYIFVSSLRSEFKGNSDLESHFIEKLPSLGDDKYKKKIQSLIQENFKSQNLMYYPLSSN